MSLFIGLDVSLAKTAICVVSEHGKIVREAEVASEPVPLLAWLQALGGNIAALGLEAGPLPKKKCVIYSRVSSTKQTSDGSGRTSQETS